VTRLFEILCLYVLYKKSKPFMRIAVDIGGTFTDLVAVDDNAQVFRGKSLTTPNDLAAASTIACAAPMSTSPARVSSCTVLR